MTIKEQIVPAGRENPEGGTKVVILADSIRTGEDMGRLVRPEYKRSPNYVNVGLFTTEEGKEHVFFGKARYHFEFKRAVEQEVGPVEKYVFGEFFFSENGLLYLVGLNEWPSKFKLHNSVKIGRIINSIDPTLMTETIFISIKARPEASYSVQRQVLSFTPFPYY